VGEGGWGRKHDYTDPGGDVSEEGGVFGGAGFQLRRGKHELLLDGRTGSDSRDGVYVFDGCVCAGDDWDGDILSANLVVCGGIVILERNSRNGDEYDRKLGATDGDGDGAGDDSGGQGWVDFWRRGIDERLYDLYRWGAVGGAECGEYVLRWGSGWVCVECGEACEYECEDGEDEEGGADCEFGYAEHVHYGDQRDWDAGCDAP
jgi:hypothetical protein